VLVVSFFVWMLAIFYVVALNVQWTVVGVCLEEIGCDAMILAWMRARIDVKSGLLEVESCVLRHAVQMLRVKPGFELKPSL